MDRIPLIKPALVKAVTANTDLTARVLTAEVVSSTPARSTSEDAPSQTNKRTDQTTNKSAQQNTASDKQYTVVLKMAQQGSQSPYKITTISNHDLQPGSQIEVKVLPGPELKIINSEKTLSSSTNNQLATLAQQLLADRIPSIQQQDIASLVKQLKNQLNQANLDPNIQTPSGQLPANTALLKEQLNTASLAAQTANKLYQSLQTNSQPDKTATINNPLLQNINNAELLKNVKNWIRNLPQSQDISTASGLKNALNNTGALSELQLANLSLQNAKLNNQSANSIFQQLQKASANLANGFSNRTDFYSNQPTTNLSQMIKNTAKALNNSTQQVFASLTKDSESSTANPTLNPTASWQNPLFNGQQHSSLTSLLQDPLLQMPSSNNKMALSQILGLGLNLKNDLPTIPLNWPINSNNDTPLLKTLQSLLGHIEREQLQQLQSSEGTQSNNPAAQTTLQQQWLPLLVLHQQQLQLIEFFIDKEEKENSKGDKKNNWFINLHFELPVLGTMGIEISMFENECSTTFWSESKTTLSQISQHIQPLRERLTEQGIIVNDIQSRHGTLAKRKQNIQQRLVDIST